MENCPCGSEKPYADCCEPLINNQRQAETAIELMRSRYTAFAKGEVEYVFQTVHPDKRDQHNKKSLENWSSKSEWRGFELRSSDGGGPDDAEGQVEFIAHYRQKGKRESHHELAHFKKHEGKWFFYDGEPPPVSQFVREDRKVGRNEPCPCGSGKKYKKCCGG